MFRNFRLNFIIKKSYFETKKNYLIMSKYKMYIMLKFILFFGSYNFLKLMMQKYTI